MTYLGIDFGTVRIGLAIATDETPSVPYGTLESSNLKSQISKVVDVIRKEYVDVVVVGRPKAMRGSDKTEIEKKTEEFVKVLTTYDLPLTSIVWQDERLSSKGADALKKEFGGSGQRDAVAAMLILDSYLSKQDKQDK